MSFLDPLFWTDEIPEAVMARQRMIRPEFWTDQKMSKLTDAARLLFIGLWNHADDSGRFNADNIIIKGALFPLNKHWNLEKITESLTELAFLGRIRLYEVDGETYGDIPKFLTHQKINRPGKSQIPPFSESITTHSVNDSRRIHAEEKRSEEKRSSGNTPDQDFEIRTPPKPQPEFVRSKPKPRPTEEQMQTVFALWIVAYQKQHHSQYHLTGQDKAAVRQLGEMFPKEKPAERERLRKIMALYVCDPDPWLAKQGWPLHALLTRVNKYIKQIAFTEGKAHDISEDDTDGIESEPYEGAATPA